MIDNDIQIVYTVTNPVYQLCRWSQAMASSAAIRAAWDRQDKVGPGPRLRAPMCVLLCVVCQPSLTLGWGVREVSGQPLCLLTRGVP